MLCTGIQTSGAQIEKLTRCQSAATPIMQITQISNVRNYYLNKSTKTNEKYLWRPVAQIQIFGHSEPFTIIYYFSRPPSCYRFGPHSVRDLGPILSQIRAPFSCRFGSHFFRVGPLLFQILVPLLPIWAPSAADLVAHLYQIWTTYSFLIWAISVADLGSFCFRFRPLLFHIWVPFAADLGPFCFRFEPLLPHLLSHIWASSAADFYTLLLEI